MKNYQTVTEAAEFLLDRLDEFVVDSGDPNETIQDWYGLIVPAMAGLRHAIQEVKVAERVSARPEGPPPGRNG